MLTSRLAQTGHLSLSADPQLSLEAYTKASEQSGLPEAQYKLGFLYGSNYGAATAGVEGEGKQGSVSTLGAPSRATAKLNFGIPGAPALHIRRALIACSGFDDRRVPPLGRHRYEAVVQRRARLV